MTRGAADRAEGRAVTAVPSLAAELVAGDAHDSRRRDRRGSSGRTATTGTRLTNRTLCAARTPQPAPGGAATLQKPARPGVSRTPGTCPPRHPTASPRCIMNADQFASVLDAINAAPRFDGALCAGDATGRFDATGDVDAEPAIAICHFLLPAMTACREWARAQPLNALNGVVGGELYEWVSHPSARKAQHPSKLNQPARANNKNTARSPNPPYPIGVSAPATCGNAKTALRGFSRTSTTDHSPANKWL